MSRTPKGNVLLEVASLSTRTAKKYVEPYSHAKSPHKFTQQQLIPCLALRAYLKTTYRGIIEILEASDALRQQLGLERLPHYSTLKKFADRSDVLHIVDCMVLEIVRQFAPDADEAAIDSTGLETTSASAHYRSRSGKARKKFIKVSVCVMAGSLLPSSVLVSWGPSNDKREAGDLLAKAMTVNQPDRVYADAGYDAEWVHTVCREDSNVESVIKPAVHRSDGTMEENGIPLSTFTLADNHAEVNTPETLVDLRVCARMPDHILYDKTADTDWVRERLHERETELVCSYRKNRKKPPTQNGRKYRRYRRRWIVERSIAWLQTFRRLIVRHEYTLTCSMNSSNSRAC